MWAFQAPIAGNMQHWHFVVVTEADRKQALADLYRKSKSENDPPITLRATQRWPRRPR